MMGQAIKQGRCQALIAENLRPICEYQISSDDQRQALVKFGAESEAYLSTISRVWDKAKFFENYQALES